MCRLGDLSEIHKDICCRCGLFIELNRENKKVKCLRTECIMVSARKFEYQVETGVYYPEQKAPTDLIYQVLAQSNREAGIR